MKKILFLISCLSFGCLFVVAQQDVRVYLQDENLSPRVRYADFLKLSADLQFEPKAGKVYGHVTHTVTPLRQQLDSLYLDGPGIRVSKVVAGKDGLQYRSTSDGLWVYFGKTLKKGAMETFTVHYEAYPKKGMYFTGWNDQQDKMRKQVWTQGQGIDNRHWLPCFDDVSEKVVTEMTLTFDEGYEVISNGKLEKKKNAGDGKVQWQYTMEKPHSPYLVMIAIGKYNYVERKSESGVPMKLYYYPEWKDRVGVTYRQSAEMMDYMEGFTGVDYPWSNYKQVSVADFLYGAMENTTATIFGDFLFVDERGALDREYLDVNAHELAHQWFGDYVTSRSAAHHWLHESFATFFQMDFTRTVEGEAHYRWWMRKNARAAIRESNKNLMGIAHSMAGSNRHYLKGSYVLDMLRYVIGEENFKDGIQHYLESFPYENVETNDFLFAIHEATGHDLWWFFEQWVRKGGEPEYEVNFKEVEQDGRRLAVFDVNQVHKTGQLLRYFKMPVKLEVHYKNGGKDSTTVWIENAAHEVTIPVREGKEVSFALFDPNSRILKSVTFEKPFEMLEAQALNAPNMIDRYDAVEAMGKYPFKEKQKAFSMILTNREFHAVKSEIAKQVLSEMHPDSYTVVSDLLADTADGNEIQKTVLSATPYIPPELLEDYEALLRAPSYRVVELALDVLYRQSSDKVTEYLEQTKHIEGVVGKNVRVKWLEIAYAETEKFEHAQELVNYTGDSYEFRTRINAAEALERLNFMNKELALNLFDAVNNPNGRLKRPCGKVLRGFYELHENRKIIEEALYTQKWTQDALKNVQRYLR